MLVVENLDCLSKWIEPDRESDAVLLDEGRHLASRIAGFDVDDE
jgi:hypothetical protein